MVASAIFSNANRCKSPHKELNRRLVVFLVHVVGPFFFLESLAAALSGARAREPFGPDVKYFLRLDC